MKTAIDIFKDELVWEVQLDVENIRHGQQSLCERRALHLLVDKVLYEDLINRRVPGLNVQTVSVHLLEKWKERMREWKERMNAK